MPSSPKPPPRLVLFNHKGGVGKTTLTVNLAYALVEAGKRVLLVDTDPQCSMSSFYLEEKYLDNLLDKSESNEGSTLWTALRPVSEGTGPIARIDPVRICQGLHLAVGDIRLSEFENSLAECWRACMDRNRRGYHCTAALSQLVDALVRRTKSDFVFFDAGPNIGPLNRVVLLDCSQFIIPAACDLFSTRALKTLGFALSQWVAAWARNTEQAPEGTPLLAGSPQLLGYIPQGFRVYRGEMSKAPISVLGKLERRVIDFVWKPLREVSGLPNKGHPSRLRLGQVKFFGDLAALGQSQGASLWDVSGGNADGKREARKVFADLAKRLISLTA